ncbi:unnamed protein product [Discosporangium mesarthrocarpum]
MFFCLQHSLVSAHPPPAASLRTAPLGLHVRRAASSPSSRWESLICLGVSCPVASSCNMCLSPSRCVYHTQPAPPLRDVLFCRLGRDGSTGGEQSRPQADLSKGGLVESTLKYAVL